MGYVPPMPPPRRNPYYYVLNKDNEPVPEDNVLAWADWFENPETDRSVRRTSINDCQISTSFLGVDHNFGMGGAPLLYETMIFGGPMDGETWRYSTYQEARHGHHEAIALVTRRYDQSERRVSGSFYSAQSEISEVYSMMSHETALMDFRRLERQPVDTIQDHDLLNLNRVARPSQSSSSRSIGESTRVQNGLSKKMQGAKHLRDKIKKSFQKKPQKRTHRMIR